MSEVLLVHPPVAKACEAPGGPARLAGALRRHRIPCRFWDANLEGQLALITSTTLDSGADSGTWTRRAARHVNDNLASLRTWEIYRNSDRYRRAVADLNRLLATAAKPYGVRMNIADYEADSFSPVRSADLLHAAARPAANPFYTWFSERLPQILSQAPVSHIGFSLNFLSQALTTFAMIGFLRRSYPHVKIIIGGGLVTSWMRGPSRGNPFTGLVDEMVAGPGEIPLLAFLGITHRGGVDCPDLEGFPLADYLAPGAVLPYSASVGCWWRRCSFCPERAEGTPYLPLPPHMVTEDLRRLARLMHPTLIHLLDSALSPSLLAALAAAPPGAPWYGFSRIIPQFANLDYCGKLKDAGCVMLKLGLESADQGVLDALKKGVDLQTVEDALKNLKTAGIATYVYLLFGTPAETHRAARRTMDFTVTHAEEIDFLNLAIFNLPAYASETEQFADGQFSEGDLSLYRPFVHPEGWNRGEVRRFLEKEFKKEPAIAAILRRDPPFFTSNHAPFLVMASPEECVCAGPESGNGHSGVTRSSPEHR